MTTENKDNSLPAIPDADATSQEASQAQRVTVITPEIVPESGDRRQEQRRQENFGKAGGARFSYTTWNTGSGGFGGGMGGGMVARDGCLPGMITLLLAAVCAVQFGVLSAIGFLVFYAIGSAAAFMLRLRVLMEGKHVSPWIFRIATWGAASLLVVWLSDGF